MKNERFLDYLQDKLAVTADILADFLFIDIRTLYNYKGYNTDNLPRKAKEKLLIFFLGFEDFIDDSLTLNDINDRLELLDQQKIDLIREAFIRTANIRQKHAIHINIDNSIKKIQNKREVNSLDEFISDFRTLVEYSNLTKGYLYTLFEIMITKIGSENDYQFLDYINKYGGKEE